MKIKNKKKKKKEEPLNNRQKIYVLERASGKSGAEAARLAGYSNKNGLARLTAYRLENIPQVKAAIKREREKRRDRLIVDENKVLDDLEVGREGAIEKGQFMAAIRASELHGRHLAMFTDKLQTEHDVVLQLKDNMEVASYGLIDILKQLAGETGKVEEIELQEVKTIKHLKIKRKGKKKDGNNGDKIYNHIQSADSIHDNPIDSTPSISNPEWKPLSNI